MRPRRRRTAGRATGPPANGTRATERASARGADTGKAPDGPRTTGDGAPTGNSLGAPGSHQWTGPP